MAKREKKEKITYIDDGRIIADMSNVSGGFKIPERKNRYAPRASLKEQFATFWAAMKLMLRPMLVVVGAMLVIYIVMYILFSLA